MRKRDRTGLAMAPLFLRLALALTFIWAGLGKFLDRFEVEGQKAAILANYGVIPNPHAPIAPRREAPPAEEAPDPLDDVPEGDPIPDPIPDPIDTPEGAADDPPSTESGGQASRPITNNSGGRAFQPATIHLTSWQDGESPSPPQILATAADFPDPVSVRGYARLVLLLHGSINPGLSDEDSSPLMPLWPDINPDTDYDHWPRYAALAAALTEIIAGILIGIGLLTRLSAFSIASVMLVAIWLTTIGPAIQTGKTTLGFLPDHAAFDTAAWSGPMWQFALLCAAASLFFSGPGTLSLDRLLLGGPPKPPAKPGPKPQGKK